EQVFAELIDGPLAHLPSGRFNANNAWLTCIAIAHNLTRALAVLAGPSLATARAATTRHRLINAAGPPVPSDTPQRLQPARFPSLETVSVYQAATSSVEPRRWAAT